MKNICYNITDTKLMVCLFAHFSSILTLSQSFFVEANHIYILPQKSRQKLKFFNEFSILCNSFVSINFINTFTLIND